MAFRPLPTPDVAVVDPRTGLIHPDWYDFFRAQFDVALVPLLYGSSINTNARAGANFLITVTNGSAFTIEAPSNPITGMVISYTVKNSSGGALGAVTWNSVFHLANPPGPPSAPANGNNRSIAFIYDGSAWLEMFRTTGDVPN